MSFRATKFVRQLRGLSPEEKAVAFVHADHDNHKGGGTNASMTTVAAESGIKCRETASRITGRLVRKGILIPRAPVTKEQGKATVYDFNYSLETCDCAVTGQANKPVTPESHPPVTLIAKPVTPDCQTCDSGVTQRRKKKEEGSLASLALRRETMIEEFSEGVYLALLEFEKYRKKIRKPLTEHALELLLKRLGELRAQGQDPVKVIEQSVMNGYQGIFPVKEAGHERPKSFHEQRSEKTAQAINRVVEYFQKPPKAVRRTLPPADK